MYMTRFRTSRNQHDDSFFKSEFMAIVKKDMWIWCRFFVFLGSVWQMEPMSNSWKTHFRIFTARWIISKKKNLWHIQLYWQKFVCRTAWEYYNNRYRQKWRLVALCKFSAAFLRLRQIQWNLGSRTPPFLNNSVHDCPEEIHLKKHQLHHCLT